MASAFRTGICFLILAGCLSLLTDGQTTTDECTSRFDGISINGRCFFVKSNNLSWSQAWASCAEDGAMLAQIHATNEYEAIKGLVISKATELGDPKNIQAWIALVREGPLEAGSCAITATTTFWYDGPTTKNPNMLAGNTWVRSHPCDDIDDVTDQNIMALTLWFGSWIGIADLPAGGNLLPAYPLCQTSTACSRTYSLNTNNECLDETPIESLTVSGFQGCADACSVRPWCRSFDMITSTSTCNLFTWISSDTVKPKMKANVGCECGHYDIDP